MGKVKSYSALLTDLSKAFDCIVHVSLIAKLETYGFSYETIKLMHIYVTDRKHKSKVNESFSDFIDLVLDVPQEESSLDLLSFNICICYFFFFVQEDMLLAMLMTQLHIQTIKILENLETKGKEDFNWFSMNYLKANPDKSQLL